MQLVTEDGQRLDLLAVKEAQQITGVPEEAGEEVAEGGAEGIDMLHYISSKYGFELKYPADLLVQERDDGRTFNVRFILSDFEDGMDYGILINPMLRVGEGNVLTSVDEYYDILAGRVQELGKLI